MTDTYSDRQHDVDEPITDQEIAEALNEQKDRTPPKPFARWKVAVIIVGSVLVAVSIATSIVLGVLLLKQGSEITRLQNQGNALAASNKSLSIASLHSQNNHHASTVVAQKAAAAQANVIIGLQMQLLASHADTDALLTRLTTLTEEATTLGPALTQGQQALLDNIAAIDFHEATIEAEIQKLETQVAALQTLASGQAT